MLRFILGLLAGAYLAVTIYPPKASGMPRNLTVKLTGGFPDYANAAIDNARRRWRD